MEKLATLFYFKEIANVKSVQNENFKTYLKTICDFENLYTNYSVCLRLRNKYYSSSFEEENDKRCVKEYNELKSCEMTRKELIKIFKERQKNFIREIYVKGKKLE